MKIVLIGVVGYYGFLSNNWLFNKFDFVLYVYVCFDIFYENCIKDQRLKVFLSNDYFNVVIEFGLNYILYCIFNLLDKCIYVSIL